MHEGKQVSGNNKIRKLVCLYCIICDGLTIGIDPQIVHICENICYCFPICFVCEHYIIACPNNINKRSCCSTPGPTLGRALSGTRKKKLYWVDINRGFLHLFDPATRQNETVRLGQKVGTVVPTTGGDALVALHDGIYRYRFSGKKLDAVCPNPENATTGNRFNDGKCDPAGHLWVGTIGPEQSAALYRMDAGGTIHTMKRGVGTSNGIVWPPNGKTMYYTDTSTGKVVAYDYDNTTGGISDPRDAIVVPREMGGPDGSTIDSDGMIWIAHWGGYCVARWNPGIGEFLCKVEVPAAHVTPCAFGGENLDTLYITTAREGLDDHVLEQYPHSGRLFVVKP